MVFDKHTEKAMFHGEESERLMVSYDNRGEPYREGVIFDLDAGEKCMSVFLDDNEAKKVRDLLMGLYPPSRI